MLLETLKPSRDRERNGIRRAVGRTEVEQRLCRELDAAGEPGLIEIRDHARSIADTLDASAEFEVLNGIIAAMI
jgi:hypothetical protein